MMPQTFIEVLKEPLTVAQMRAMCDEESWIDSVVEVGLFDVINGDTESWLEILSNALTGTASLMDVSVEMDCLLVVLIVVVVVLLFGSGIAYWIGRRKGL